MEGNDHPGLTRWARAQQALVRALLESDSLSEAGTSFLATAAGLLGWEVAGLWEVPPGEEELRFIEGWDDGSLDAEPLRRASRELVLGAADTLPARAWASGEAVRAEQLGFDPSFHRSPAVERLGLHQALAIPIPAGFPEGAVAVAEFFTRGQERPSDELVDLLLGFGDELSLLITRWRAEEELRTTEGLHAAVVNGTQDAVITKDLEAVVTSWNKGAERLYGYSAKQAVGRHISFIIPPERKNEEMEILRRIVSGEVIETYETERVRADGRRVEVSLTVSPIEHPRIGIAGASVVGRDITSQKSRERAREFLLNAGRRFDASLDPIATARTIVDTAVPALAELCLIDFVRDDGTIGDSVVASIDPKLSARLEEIRSRSPLDPGGDHPVAQTLRAREPMVWPDLTAEPVMDQIAQSDEHRSLMLEAGYSSATVVPLIARDRLVGALSFLHIKRDLRYDPDDLDLLADLGSRAAIVLENARLYHDRDAVANDLQRALRPAGPPELEGLESAVLFEPAGDGIEVGGDFYDVIPINGSYWVIVGDVVGKGSVAAANSVSVRHTLRTLAAQESDPAVVLQRGAALLESLPGSRRYATAIVARLSRGDAGWDLHLASAGHPPAVLLSGDGADLLGGGTMLGSGSEPAIDAHITALGSGQTLLVYTDGLYEVGPPERHLTPEALAEVAGASAHKGVEALVEDLRAAALRRGNGSLRDDLVILAVRG